MPKLRADIILEVLRKKHAGEVFLTEVKTGPTIARGSGDLQRLDALAIKKSWSNPCFTAYEVKVSRSDFMRDDKWAAYLNYCHRFYFACPSGLIKPEELPAEVGIVWVNPEGGYSVRRAARFRPIEIPWEMLYYLVISRMDPERHPFFSSRREYLEAWVQDKEDRYYLGYHVSEKFKQLLEEYKERAAEAERKAKQAEQALDAVAILKEFGLGPSSYGFGDWWKNQLRERLSTTLPEHVVRRIKEAKAELELALSQTLPQASGQE